MMATAALARRVRAPAVTRPGRLPCFHHPPPSSYHTAASPPDAPFSTTESALLSAALSHVPELGFTSAALARGAQDAGYLPASTAILLRGPFELVRWHLVTRRLGLSKEVQFPQPSPAAADGPPPLGVAVKVRALVLARLRGNAEVVRHWQDALALSAQPANVPTMLAELAGLADEIWYLAGDQAVDFSWYTKRASIAALYASAELFQTTDTSAHFAETEAFVDRRLEEIQEVGGMLRAAREWAAFSARGAVNVARSKGVPI